jgi:hypothetical protein
LKEDQIIKGIKDNHLFCCGNDLGEIEKGKALFCGKCSSLYLPNTPKQKRLEEF